MRTVDRAPSEAAALFLEYGAVGIFPDLPVLDRLSPEQLSALPGLPYPEPEFSRRLLRAQLDQSTTDSSRPRTVIAAQLNWLAKELGYAWRPSAVHHPFCGPGNYVAELRSHGMRHYLGVDVAPAVIEYARHRFRTESDIHFVLGDGANARLLPRDRSYDTLLLTYDAINFRRPSAARAMLAPLVRRLAAHGTLVCELLLAESGIRGFDDGRRVDYRPDGSVLRGGPHHMLSEGFVHRTGEVVGHRFITMAEGGASNAEILHSFLFVPTERDLCSMLHSLGLAVVFVGRPFVDSDDPNLNRHIVVATKSRTTNPLRSRP